MRRAKAESSTRRLPSLAAPTGEPVTGDGEPGDGEPVHVFTTMSIMAFSLMVQLPVSQVQSLCTLQVTVSVLNEQARVIFVISARDTSVISVSMVALVGNDVKSAMSNDVKPVNASVITDVICASK